MMRRLTILLAVVAALGTFASTAQAGYYFAESEARFAARDFARDRYDMPSPAAACRPQGRSEPESGYSYHRWVCGWADVSDDDDGDQLLCSGKVVIMGSRQANTYWSKVLRGIRCE